MKLNSRWILLSLLLLLMTSVACIDAVDDEVLFSPAYPTPDNGAAGISLTPTLRWTCNHPDNLDLTYEVYMGKDGNLILVAEGLRYSEYHIEDALDSDTEYIWRVMAFDEEGRMGTHEVWRFQTTSE